VRPPPPQVAEPFRLALHSNAFVEIESLGDGVSLRSRMSADLLEFPDILAQRMVGAHHRPDPGNFGFPHVEHARSYRGQQPLMERRAVVIAVEILVKERKLREGMRAVDDDLYPPRARQLANLLDGEDLARSVGDVAYVDDLRLRREALLDTTGEKI